MSLEVGSTLGRYEIVARAGAGGMGEVYRARDTRLDRTVAIKVLPPHVADDPQWQARFEREARSVSGLNHPRICALHDIGQHDDTHFLVMEYLEGETLAKRLERGPLSSDQALDYGQQIADALAAAHRAGLVHRDLKPGNVMLTETGAKLLDFGLAKPVQASGATPFTAAPTATSPLTAVGTVVGTFQYMAPEVLEGGEADARSDIFAFGAVLYETLTARPAFSGKTQASVVAAILKEEAQSLATLAPTSPPALDRLVQRCLAKDPDARWQSASDLAQELAWLARGDATAVGAPPTATIPAARGTARLAWATAALFAAVAGVLAVLLARGPDGAAAARPVRFEVAAPDGLPLRSMDEEAAPVAVSPDGRSVVFGVMEPDGSNRLWLRALDDPRPRPLPGTEHGARPFWSPDGLSVAYFTTTELRRVDIDGSPPLTLCSVSTGRGGSWNADGTIVFSRSAYAALSRVSADGGEPQAVTTLDASVGESSHRYPEFLPDGRHFTFLSLGGSGASGTGSESDNRLMLGSLDGAPPRLLVAGVSNASYGAGYLVFRRGQALQARPFDAERLEFTGEAVTIADAVQYDAGYERAIFSASDRLIAFVPGSFRGQTDLQLWDRSGRVLQTFADAVASDLAFSPDGRKLAARVVGAQGEAIWIFDLERDARTRLTFAGGIQVAPVWSPDGRRIAYAHTTGSEARLEIMPADGNGDAQILLEGAFASPVDWTADGRYLLLSWNDRDASFDILLLDLNAVEDGPRPLIASPQHNETLPAVSPDGRWMAYSSDETGRSEVYLTRFPSAQGKWLISTGGGLEPAWNPAGDRLYYRGIGYELMEVALDVAGDAPRVDTPRALFPLTSIFDLEIGMFDVSPDGERFIVSVLPEDILRTPITLVYDWTAGLR